MPASSRGFAERQSHLKILIVKHSLGNRYGGPAEDLEEFLISEYPEATVTVLSHPLTSWSNLETSVKVYTKGVLSDLKVVPRRIKGPARHFFDVFFGPKRSEFDFVFGFNSLALFLGLMSCKNQSAQLVSWGVDYVPPKNRGGFQKYFVALLQKLLTERISFRVENTHSALMERDKEWRLPSSARSFVVPIGVWKRDFLAVEDLLKKNERNLLYLGAINERTGTPMLLGVLDELDKMNVNFTCDVIGDGPLLDWLKIKIEEKGLGQRVFVRGYLPDIPDTKRILSVSSIGLAPFSANPENFTFFSDPQKIRRYLSSGLVVVSSKVPPIAMELGIHSGFVGIDPDESAKSWARAIADLLGNTDRLRLAQRAALEYSETFENSLVFGKVLKQIFKT
jgi:glycosyltransferase involved in cell wall biosynthesis